MQHSESVLIVGAGPTGLTLANALARFRVPFRIVDQNPGHCRDSKGLAINIASQYGMELIGLNNALGRAGCRVHRLNILWRGRRFSAIDFRRLGFHIDSFITQRQSDTERELTEALVVQGHEVHWKSRVIAIDQYRGGAEATFEGSDGTRSIRNFGFIVGCDGKHSIVRRHMDAHFAGHDFPMHFVLGDFELSWNASPDQVYYYVYDDVFFIIVPIDNHTWRVVVKCDGALPRDDRVHPGDIKSVVSRFMGNDFFKGDPIWISRAPFYSRTVDRLRQHCLFLAGDASHLFSPIGGMGMNTGIQDALNLAWKLAYVFHDRAGDALLDSYEKERLEAISLTANMTNQSTRMIARVEQGSETVSALLPMMANRSGFRFNVPLKHSGLALAYTQACRSHGGTSVTGSHSAGELCLGAGALREAIGSQPGTEPVPPIIGVARVGDAESGLDRLDGLRRFQCEFEDCLRWIVVLPDAEQGSRLRRRYPELTFLRQGARALQFVRLAADALILVLPDGVVSYSGTLADLGRLRAAIASRFLRPNSQPAVRARSTGSVDAPPSGHVVRTSSASPQSTTSRSTGSDCWSQPDEIGIRRRGDDE